MNKEDSLALFAKGRDAWNEWAEHILEERRALEAAGTWLEDQSESDWSDETRAWHTAAAADFSNHTFKESREFSKFVFPGNAWFSGATFTGEARFDGATFASVAQFREATFAGEAQFFAVTFAGEARFNGATFAGDAWFGRATFTGGASFELAAFSDLVQFIGATFTDAARFNRATFTGTALFISATFGGAAWFGGVTFGGAASFDGATFGSEAWFGGATFERYTTFKNTTFEHSADFGAIEAKRAFSLAGATFLAVPDFIQANFSEAPRLDDSRIASRRFWPTTLARVKERVKGDPDLAARWRALKRLAIQGRDHAREQVFFAGEMKERRWCEDKPWHAVFWFGVFYQVLSDFGRSILRPLVWWGVSVLGFAMLYLNQYLALVKGSWSSFGWVFQRLTGLGGEVAPHACVAGPGEPSTSALLLSVQKGLLLSGLIPASKLNAIYACLYGIHTADTIQPRQLPASFSPVIPDVVTALGFFQYPLSAVLIFLFLLAIRNHFRIK